MRKKLLVIQQYFGLGDIIWGQTIAHSFLKNGYKVIWPVQADLVEGLNRAYPEIVFVDFTRFLINYENKDFKEENDMRYLPMRYSEALMGKPYRFHMEAKYSFLGLSWRTWKDHAMPVRSRAHEVLLGDIVGVPKEPYNFVSTNFGKNFSIPIEVNNGNKNIFLQKLDGFSLFDWCAIIENADTIHAISSSSLYLFELLSLKAREIHIYARKPVEQNLDYTKFFYTKNYTLHE